MTLSAFALLSFFSFYPESGNCNNQKESQVETFIFLRIYFNVNVLSGDCEYQVCGWYEVDGSNNVTGHDVYITGVQEGCGSWHFSGMDMGNTGSDGRLSEDEIKIWFEQLIPHL